MKRIYKITTQQLALMERDQQGAYIIPENIKLMVEKSNNEKIIELEKELEKYDVPEPTQQELVEYAKGVHPYYSHQFIRERIREEIDELKKNGKKSPKKITIK